MSFRSTLATSQFRASCQTLATDIGRRWVITSLSGRASNQRLNESYLAPCNCQLLVKTQAIFDRSSRCNVSAALRLASLADGLALSWLHRVLVNMVSILIRLVGAAFESSKRTRPARVSKALGIGVVSVRMTRKWELTLISLGFVRAGRQSRSSSGQ